MERSAYSARSNSWLGRVLAVAILAGSVGLGWFVISHANENPLSDDAILIANTVNVASTVPGRVVAINVRDNQRVHANDLMVEVDPTTYRIAVEQATADLALAEAGRDAERRTIAAQQANAQVAEQQIDHAKVNLALAEQTLSRLAALAPKGYVTQQQVDDARSARDNAQDSLAQALKQAEAAKVIVDTLDSANALVRTRQAAQALAEHNLEETKLFAPHDGLVVGLTTSTGEIAGPGQALFTLIDTRTWYASASFPETELDRIRIGDCARVYVLSDTKKVVKGQVDSIGWGISSQELVNLPRALPYVPKTLNWVRLYQRFPVRVKLLDPPDDLMRIGASATVIVDHDQPC